MLALDGAHLAVGLSATWLVGVGRHWHDPYASWLERGGLASLLYLGALSVFLWLLYLPLRPAAWGLWRTLTFLGLVSPVALLQAVPVEYFVGYSSALRLGAWVLIVVIAWRVALLLWFLVRAAGLRPLEALASILLPVDVIEILLAHFDVRHEIDRFVNQSRSLDVLAAIATLSLPLPLLAYVVVVLVRLIERRRSSA